MRVSTCRNAAIRSSISIYRGIRCDCTSELVGSIVTGRPRRVEVVSLRNPDTIESRIWDILNSKINNITLALHRVMDEPEDLFQLVLGMTSPAIFRDLFSGASDIPEDSLSDWFDETTASFGGHDVIDAVRDLVGNCDKFDFQQVPPRRYRRSTCQACNPSLCPC